MILAIDIGNSNIVVGFFEKDTIIAKARMATDSIKTSDQYWMELDGIFSLFHINKKEIDGVIISSVVPPVLNSCRTAVKKMLAIDPLIVGPGIKTGLNIRTDNPAQVGSDLIAAAVAAVKQYPKPILIIDMGTATTITAIDADGAFIGGCICPGVRISAEALSSRAAQLPAISLEAPNHVIGRNTIDCMQSGVMLGAASMLDGLVEHMEKELGCSATVVATGGISRYVIPMCKREIHYDNELLLKGLVALYAINADR